MNRSIGIILSNYFFDKKNGIIQNYFTNKYQICSFIKSNNIFISLISIIKIYDINQINISCINLGLFNFIIEYMNNNLGMFIIGLRKKYRDEVIPAFEKFLKIIKNVERNFIILDQKIILL